MGELISLTHPVRIVSDILDKFDISDIEATYKGGGTSSYHPSMLLKVVVYAYLCNVYSGRKMEKLLCENIHFIWLSGMSRPDFRTINRFRSERLSGGRLDGGMIPYVKYNMFHAEMKRKYKNNPFLPDNMYYNKEQDYYVCPMGQHMDLAYYRKEKSDLGYISTKNAYRAKELLMSGEGLMHRSKRPIEPEAVFGNIKFNHSFKRFRLKSAEKVSVEWGLVPIVHNLRKYIARKTENSNWQGLFIANIGEYLKCCRAA